MGEYLDPYNWEVGNWAKFVCAGQAALSNMYPTQGGTFHLIICLYYSHLLEECLKVWLIKLGWRKFGVRPQVKYCRQKWVINLSFRYHESLFLIFEVFQFNESRCFPESIFQWIEKELFCWWEVSKFLCAALFVNARKVDVSDFRLKIKPVWDSNLENLYSYFSCK